MSPLAWFLKKHGLASVKASLIWFTRWVELDLFGDGSVRIPSSSSLSWKCVGICETFHQPLFYHPDYSQNSHKVRWAGYVSPALENLIKWSTSGFGIHRVCIQPSEQLLGILIKAVIGHNNARHLNHRSPVFTGLNMLDRDKRPITAVMMPDAASRDSDDSETTLSTQFKMCVWVLYVTLHVCVCVCT